VRECVGGGEERRREEQRLQVTGSTDLFLCRRLLSFLINQYIPLRARGGFGVLSWMFGIWLSSPFFF